MDGAMAGSENDEQKQSADPRFRVGILDVAAMVVVLFALLFPAQSGKVEGAYDRTHDGDPKEIRKSLADLEGRLAANPQDQRLAEDLARQLEAIGQHDQALRVWPVPRSPPADLKAGERCAPSLTHTPKDSSLPQRFRTPSGR
jgi:hypothetical protein